MLKIKLNTLILALIFLAGCKTVEMPFKRTVEPVPAQGNIPDDVLVYALPRTVLHFRVSMEKVIQKKGPFFNYRKKYLGLTEGISTDRTFWKLEDVKVAVSEEVDPAQYYMVRSSGPVYSNYLHLTKAGLVMTPVPGMLSANPVFSAGEQVKDPLTFFTDLSVKRNIDQVKDTAYKQVATDTGFIKVPYVEYKNRLKTTDEKAGEASDFIIKIRKRRFKLLSGQYDVFPESTALSYAVARLNRLEEEYLALFLGKTVKQSYIRTFIWVPGPDNTEKELFRFSEKNGIVLQKIQKAVPVMATIEPHTENPMIGRVQVGDSSYLSSLIYRTPVPVPVSVSYAKTKLAVEQVMMDQFGPLFRLPETYLSSPEDQNK